MKSYIRTRYCGPEDLELQEFPVPSLKPNEVLIKVKATSVNPADWHMMRGTPYFIRLMIGFKPKNIFIGSDMAGVVEKIGDDVKSWKPGDAVVSDIMRSKTGAFGEYAVATEDILVGKPENVSFEDAAALPIAGLTALQALRDWGSLQEGQRVLINGASGGVGSYAVQIAKWMGTEVTGICSTLNVELVKSLGADHVIDYKHEDFRTKKEKYDLILDLVGNCTASTARKLLNPNGTVLLIGWGGFAHMIKFMTHGAWLNKTSHFNFKSNTAKMHTSDLQQLLELLESGQIKSLIDKTYTFEQLREAIAYQEKGHARGKVVVHIS